jgi:hypothetical protein
MLVCKEKMGDMLLMIYVYACMRNIEKWKDRERADSERERRKKEVLYAYQLELLFTFLL